MSTLPPPPPPGGTPTPGTPDLPPPPMSPPPVSGGAGPTPNWWANRQFGLPRWAWLGIVAVVVAGIAVVTLGGGDDDGGSGSDRTDSTSDDSDDGDVVAGAPAGATGDQDDPVPVGEIADIGGGWRLQVVEVIPDATELISTEDSFNDPPPTGKRYTLVRVALGYFGREDPASLFETSITAFGAANVELDTECGFVPDRLESFSDMFAGGVVAGNLCFVTSPEDEPALILSATGEFFSSDATFVAATPTSGAIAAMAPLAGPQAGATSTEARLDPVPIGQTVDVGEDWTATIDGPARDVTEELLSSDNFNLEPPDGFRYIGVDVTLTYSGEGTGTGFEVSLGAVGDDNVQLDEGCGFIEGGLDLFTDVLAGGSISGSACFIVPEGESSLVLYRTDDFGENVMAFAVN